MLLLASIAACISLGGPNITAADLAKAVPTFAPANPAAVVSYAPSPGATRIYHPAELQAALERFGFEGPMPLDNVCFERSVQPLTSAVALEAMHSALGADARIEIVELSHFGVPPGDLVFSRDNLGQPPVAYWHGYVRYDGSKKFPIWARVTVTVKSTKLVALEDLKPGIPIRPTQLKLVETEAFPEKHSSPASAEDVDGCIPRHIITAGSPVWTDSYNPPNDVNRGERVVVHVHSGQAQLSFDASAESSGRRGDEIAIKNPESGRVFRARVEGPGLAFVQTFR
jgi:flagella basal body P-ring formation protein FlgA